MTSILQHELRRVTAPASLWDRVEMPRASRPAFQPMRWVAVAASVAVAVFGWALLRPYEIQTSDAARIETWVRSQTGLDVSFAGQPPVATRLTGARRVNAHTAEIAFTAAAVPAVLRLESAGGDVQSHARPLPGARSVSWVSGGQRYTIETATPQAMETACRLCHG